MEAKEEQSERQIHRSSRCHGSSFCNSLLWAFSSSSSSLTKHAVAKCGKLLLTSDVFDSKRSRQTLATSLPPCYTWFSPCQSPCFELSRQILYSCLKLANANLRASTSSSHVGAWWCLLPPSCAYPFLRIPQTIHDWAAVFTSRKVQQGKSVTKGIRKVTS